tara:strand:+ start:150 stop:446 length:297 start_codon:yes stop_codon:yes gene_type:complete
MKILTIFLSLVLGPIAGSGIFNKYWLPPEVRQYVIPPKYDAGVCLSSNRWGVNPKVVIGHKESKSRSNYLLKDHDRYQHLQYVSSFQVEKYATVVACR